MTLEDKMRVRGSIFRLEERIRQLELVIEAIHERLADIEDRVTENGG